MKDIEDTLLKHSYFAVSVSLSCEVLVDMKVMLRSLCISVKTRACAVIISTKAL